MAAGGHLWKHTKCVVWVPFILKPNAAYTFVIFEDCWVHLWYQILILWSSSRWPPVDILIFLTFSAQFNFSPLTHLYCQFGSVLTIKVMNIEEYYLINEKNIYPIQYGRPKWRKWPLKWKLTQKWKQNGDLYSFEVAGDEYGRIFRVGFITPK